MATDLNGHSGLAAEPNDAPLRAATLPDDGPTGTFFTDEGPLPW